MCVAPANSVASLALNMSSSQWFRIVHKDNFYSAISPSPHQVRTPSPSKSHDRLSNVDTEEDLLLCLCMFLITYDSVDTSSSNDMFSSLYRITKQAFATISSLSTPNTKMVQCGALITLYEFGHGRARFAYRTLGITQGIARCVGVIPELVLGNSSLAGPPALEAEKQDMWWGMFILDQYPTSRPALHGKSAAALTSIGTFIWTLPPRICLS